MYKGYYATNEYFFQYAEVGTTYILDVTITLTSYNTIWATTESGVVTTTALSDGRTSLSQDCKITPSSGDTSCSYLVGVTN